MNQLQEQKRRHAGLPGRFRVDVGSMFVRIGGEFRSLVGSWEGLGKPWGRLGRHRSHLYRFPIDAEANLGPKPSEIDRKSMPRRIPILNQFLAPASPRPCLVAPELNAS